MITAALKEYHPFLVSRNHDINADLAESGYYNSVLFAIKQYEKALDEAGQVSDDLKPEVKRRQQQEMIGAAVDKLMADVDRAAQPYKAATGAIRQEIENASRPGTHKSEISELTTLLKVQEIRRVMESLTSTERSQLLRSTVAAGDASILHALEGSIVPLVPAHLIDLARQTYQDSAIPDRVQALALAEAYAGSVGTTQRFIESAARGLANKAGLAEVYATRGEPLQQLAKSMSDSEKTAYISQHGLDSFKSLLG